MASGNHRESFRKELRDWLVDPSLLDWVRGADGKMTVGTIIARGTQGTVYRSLYGGHTVAVKEFHATVIKGLDVELPGASGLPTSRSDIGFSKKKPQPEMMVPDESMSEFFTEARALHSLHHPSCLSLYGISLEPTVFFVTEYCPETLARVLFTPGLTISLNSMIRWARQIAAGMHYLHSKGITHRDLKPENILLTRGREQLEEAEAKICDFGIAQLQKAPQARGLGTPHYLAPELYSKSAASAGRVVCNYEAADVYAFAMLLWVMFTRKKPYFDIPFGGIPEKVQGGQRPILPDELAKTPLAGLVRKCWLPDPEARPKFPQVYSDLSQLGEHMMSYSIPVAAAQADGLVLFGFGLPLEQVSREEVSVSGLEAAPFLVTIPRCLTILWESMLGKNALATEGLFRVSPSQSSYHEFKNLMIKRTLSEPEKLAELDRRDVHVLARLLQDFFREIPGGFFQSQTARDLQKLNHITWIAPESQESPSVAAAQLNSAEMIRTLRAMLGEEKYAMLSWLVDVLGNVMAVKENRMGPGALGLVWGPTLDGWQSSVEPTQEQRLQQLSHNESVRGLVKRMLILKHHLAGIDSPLDLATDAVSDTLNNSSVGSSTQEGDKGLGMGPSLGVGGAPATGNGMSGTMRLGPVVAGTLLIDVLRVMFHSQSALKWADALRLLHQNGVTTMGCLWRLAESSSSPNALPPAPSWEFLSGELGPLHAQALGKFRDQSRPADFNPEAYLRDVPNLKAEGSGQRDSRLLALDLGEEGDLELLNVHPASVLEAMSAVPATPKAPPRRPSSHLSVQLEFQLAALIANQSPSTTGSEPPTFPSSPRFASPNSPIPPPRRPSGSKPGPPLPKGPPPTAPH